MKTRFLEFLGGLASFLILGLLLIALSPVGVHLAAYLLANQTKGSLSLHGVQGRLIDKITIRSIDFENDRMRIQIENAQLSWNALALLNATVSINEIKTASIHIETLGETSSAESAFKLEDLQSPNLTLIVDHFETQDLHFNAAQDFFTQLSGSLVLNEQGLRLRDTHLTHPSFKIDLQANLGPGFDPPLRIQAQELLTSGQGKTQLEGDLSLIKGTTTFSGIFESTIDVVIENLGPDFKLELKAQDLQFKDYPETKLSFSALIQPAQVLIQTFSLHLIDDFNYQLKQPSTLVWNEQGPQIDPPLCLVGPSSSKLCADVPLENQLRLRLQDFPSQLLSRYFSDRFETTGNLAAQALVIFTEKGFDHLEASLDLSPMKVLRGKQKQRIFFETGPSHLELFANQDLLTAKGKVSFIETDRLEVDLQVNDWRDEEKATLLAQFTGTMTRWDPLRLWVTDTNDFSGQAKLALTVQGQLLSPEFKGGLDFTDARLAIPSQGIVLEEGKLSLKPDLQDKELRLEGSLRSGEGRVNLSGKVFLENAWPALDLRIQGERFMLSNTDSALVLASPDLRLQLKEKLFLLTGIMHIPEADLQFKGYRQYIAPSPDIVIKQEKPKELTALYQLNTRVLLSLGKKISLKASHLKTGVEGGLHLVKLGKDPVRASGQLSAVNGTYAAYGKKLDLTQAILTFNNSPLDNPSLFIEASRQVQLSLANNSQYMFADPGPKAKTSSQQEGTVGIRISGTVQSPKYTFFSTPPMPEADQLSYLLTGGPSSQVGGASAAFMFAALSETAGLLGVSDTDASRLQSLSRSIGIDFNIESGTTGSDTNLVLGKAIRPRLYVSYTVGLLDPMNMFQVRYQLSRRFALQTSTNTQGDTGGDILYGIETDNLFGIE